MPARQSHSSRALLQRLSAASREYGGDAAARKRALLEALAGRRLRTAAEVRELHDQLCFLRAYPDDGQLLALVEALLAPFAERADLRRHARALADSGLDGTPTYYRFFWPVARWLAERWPAELELTWSEPEGAERLDGVLPAVVTPPEAVALKRLEEPARRKLGRLLAEDETDAAFLVRRIAAMPGDSFTREALHDGLDLEYRLRSGAGTPARTSARHRESRAVFRDRPLSRARPDLARELRRPPQAVREASRAEGQRLVDLALEAMVTRSRDLEAFGYADPRDARVVDDGGGLEFACLGVTPERRRVLHATYGLLSLQSGVPIGYVQADVLFESVGLSFNTFPEFRGAEAARVFGRLLAALRHLFGARSFSFEPYQLGHRNREAIDSGAWWFYRKLGFAPRDPGALRLARSEEARLRRDPGHRSSKATLRKLAAHPTFWPALRNPPPPPPWDLGLVIARELAARGGADRETATKRAVQEARALLGLRSLTGWTRDERRALERWSPLTLALPGLERWSPAERRELGRVIRAKGGRCEADFVRRFDGHPRLARAVLRLAGR